MNKEFRPAADFLPTKEENPNGGPIAGSGAYSWRHQWFGGFDDLAEMGAHGSGDEDVECARVRADFSAFKGGNAQMQSHVIRNGADAAALVARYSVNGGSTFADLAAVPLINANANVPIVGTRVAVPNAAVVSDLLLKLVRRGGNGTIKPAVWNAIIEVASGTGPGGKPSDLPQGNWGTILWDINAVNLAALYADGDEVNYWPDVAGGYDAVTNAGSLINAPHYRATGIAGGLPCVQATGNNIPLRAINPTKPTGDWTYYFVTSEVDGGDTGYIMDGSDGYPFGFALWATSSQMCGQVNTNAFGSTADCATASIGSKHIWRFVKSSGAVHWYLYLDGTLVAQNSANPQTNDTNVIRLLDYSAGLGMDAKLGRGVAYNRAHTNPNPLNSTPANGLTGPELVLKAFWGTP